MIPTPFYFVTLTHSTWESAMTYAKELPGDALPEVRLDLFLEEDPGAMVDALHRRCLVTCRRVSEGGKWPDGDEAGRMERLRQAVASRPAWIELEWDLAIPSWLEEHRTHIRLLRYVHVPEAPEQLSLSVMKEWRLGRLHRGIQLCGVLGESVLESQSPAIYNAAFQRQVKDLLYLPLECGDAQEAAEAIEALPLLGVSLSAPLEDTLPNQLGLHGPLDALWRRSPGHPWHGANTDAEAMASVLRELDPVAWNNKEDSTVATWARETGLRMVEASRLIELCAETQARRFIQECGE